MPELPQYATTLDTSLPLFNYNEPYANTQTPNPGWKAGDGANSREIMAGHLHSPANTLNGSTSATTNGASKNGIKNGSTNGTFSSSSSSSNDEPEDWIKYSKVGFDPASPTREPSDNYKFMTSSFSPRPVAFVSTVSSTGVRNLAPFSYFQIMSNNPIVFSLGISKGRGHMKDTAKNLQSSKECTINITSEWFIEAANYSCMNAPDSVSEWKLTGLTPVESKFVSAPHVLESPVSVECKVIHDIPILHPTEPGRETGNVFLLQAVYVHAREDIFDPQEGENAFGTVLLEKIKPVSRLQGITYGRSLQTFDMPKIDFERERNLDQNKELYEEVIKESEQI